ncbi:hypothetical protein WT97_19795 [Burkholderia sp. MSMB1459WGS]|nr:hypothetical protein WT97_19795 [Burkholderia sp. MSMB1459WGS]
MGFRILEHGKIMYCHDTTINLFGQEIIGRVKYVTSHFAPQPPLAPAFRSSQKAKSSFAHQDLISSGIQQSSWILDPTIGTEEA